MNTALASLTDCIRPELAVVDRLFHEELTSRVSCVNTLVKHVSRFRGKMLRPCLVLMSGKASGELAPAHNVIATVVEMVHMATLVHDDVLDEAVSGDGGLATLATLSHPRGIAVDSAGNVYISDTFNNRIRVVTPNGVINTIAGSGQGYGGDGGLAINATFSNPAGICFDSSNNLYVADNNNQVIREISFSTSTGGSKPAIGSGGVITAGSFGAFSAMSPGSWIEIYGSNLAADTRSWGASDFNGINAPISLDGTTVTIAGLNAYVDYISPTQVNAQVPAGVGPGPQPVIINTAAGSSAAATVTVNATEPGLYAPPSFKANGKQYVGAVFSDGATFAMPPGTVSGITSRQAHVGETITIYGVGFGTTNSGAPGQITQGGNSLTAPFQVLFGSASATVTYAGLAPSAVGLYQFNVVVPNVAASDTVPITFLLSGVGAPQTLYTAVQ